MIDKKIYIYFLLILLVSLSGCLEFITTREKQACLALTHYSSTSINDCFSQKKCFQEIENFSISKNQHLPISLSQEIDTYKNYLASSHYYYTLTKEQLDILHKGCEKEEIKTILDNYNSAMDLFSKTFSYVDNATKKSMLIVIDYALFLESQDIELIAEEELFQDFIILNENINYMKKQEENNSYLSTVNEKIKELYQYSKELGFKETYLGKENLSDLTLYYLEIYQEEINSQEINLPEINRINSFVYKKLSNIEDLRNINYSLNKLEGYNFYILINNLVGQEKSLVTEFRELNNNVSKNLNVVYDKIDEFEKIIEENKKYLSEEKYLVFLKEKNEFKNKTNTFGKYLSFLKETDLEIKQNQENYFEEKLEDEEIFGCDLLIEKQTTLGNLYVSRLINQYQKSNNLVEKKEICRKIKNSLEIKECQEKMQKFIESEIEEAKDYELFVYTTQQECIEHINNINYKLNSNRDILYLREKIKEIEASIEEIYAVNKNPEHQSKVLSYRKKISEIKEKNNVDIILEINLVLEQLEDIEKNIDEIIKQIIIEERHHKIVIIEEEYYLEIINSFSKTYGPIEITNKYPLLKSKDTQLKVTSNKLTAYNLYPGKNYYQVEYENRRAVDFKIMFLSLKESIIKIIIKNEIEGIYDSLDFIEGFYTKTEGVKIEDHKIKYLTKKENEIYLVGNVFQIKETTEIEQITEEKMISTTKYVIRNKWIEDIDREIFLTEINSSNIYSLYLDGKEITPSQENNTLYFRINLKKNETKEYTLKALKDREEVYTEVREMILAAEKLKNSRFIDISKIAAKELKLILDISYTTEYSLEEISKIYSQAPQLQNLLALEDKYALLEESYLKTLNEILKKEITSPETKAIEKIERDKYNDMPFAEKEITKLFEKINQRIKESSKESQENSLAEFRELKEIVFLNNLKNIDLERLSKDYNISMLREIIDLKLKERAEEVYYSVNPVTNSLDDRKINDLITRVYLLYENYSLTDLYSVGYFSGITENDAKRLEKNYVFLEGVLFNKELSNFEEKFDQKKYQEALKSISLETINRVEKIKSDYENLSKGIEQIKEDAKKEIIEYQKKEHSQEILNFAKNNYQDEKYLDVIYQLKQNKSIKEKPKYIQYVITFLIIIIFLSVYIYLRLGTKKKEKTMTEKKKKILRN